MNLNILQQLKSGRNISAMMCLMAALTLCALPAAASPARGGAGHQNLVALVKGKVNDSKGQPLPGAVIKIKGSKNATATDASGAFSIEAEPGAVLVVSFIGYLPKEVAVADNSFITVELQEDNRSMQEVVVVGYGAVKKSDLTGSVSSVKGDDLNLGGTTANVGQAIQGKAAGVQVQQSNFAPGGGINVTIRAAIRSIPAMRRCM